MLNILNQQLNGLITAADLRPSPTNQQALLGKVADIHQFILQNPSSAKDLADLFYTLINGQTTSHCNLWEPDQDVMLMDCAQEVFKQSKMKPKISDAFELLHCYGLINEQPRQQLFKDIIEHPKLKFDMSFGKYDLMSEYIQDKSCDIGKQDVLKLYWNALVQHQERAPHAVRNCMRNVLVSLVHEPHLGLRSLFKDISGSYFLHDALTTNDLEYIELINQNVPLEVFEHWFESQECPKKLCVMFPKVKAIHEKNMMGHLNESKGAQKIKKKM